MKTLTKFFVAALCLTMSASQLKSQGLYVNVGLGYGLSASPSKIGEKETESSVEGVYGSFGQGLNFGATIGNMFNENVGAELGISYLMGSTFKTSEYDNSGGTPVTANYESKGKMIRFIPAIKLVTGDDMKLYGKFGLVLGMGAGIDIDRSASGDIFGSPFTATGKDELSGGMSMGWMGAVGVEFPAGDKLSVFIELNSINQSYAPSENKWTTSFTQGGTTDSDGGTIKYEDTVSAGSSDTELKEYSSFSSFGINAGITFNLGD